MKLRKLISGVAVVTAAASFATAASATLAVVPQDGHFRSGTGMWMPILFSDGTKDTSEKDATDYGIDLYNIGSVVVTMKSSAPEYFEGSFGGGIILSTAGTSHNWNSKEYWGVIDEDKEIDTLNADAPVQFKKIGDNLYEGVMLVDDSNCVPTNEDVHLVQLAIQEWGQEMDDMVVVSCVVKDKDGNEMISFDANGKASLPLLDGSEAPAEEETPADTEAPAEEPAEEEDTAPAEEEDEDVASDDEEDDDVAADEEAPAEEEKPATEDKPAAGNVDAATDSSKGSPDTGVADVAAVAGLAIVAAGAVIVSKKRK